MIVDSFQSWPCNYQQTASCKVAFITRRISWETLGIHGGISHKAMACPSSKAVCVVFVTQALLVCAD